jgi:hypothetical protein
MFPEGHLDKIILPSNLCAGRVLRMTVRLRLARRASL